jgi:hypothetical protein
LVAWPGAAGADRAGAVVDQRPDRVEVDWTRGLLVAVGAAGADLRAPSPDVARVGAERRARQAARDRLDAAARELPMADGRLVAEHLDEAAAARLATAVAAALELDLDYGADGSCVARLAVPLEAVRAALGGPEPALALGGAGPADGREPTALVVDATRIASAPRLGLAVVAGDVRYAGPTVFFSSLTAAKRDPRLGARVARARALAVTGGALELAVAKDVAAAAQARALVVVVLGPDRPAEAGKVDAGRTDAGRTDGP